jgi:hypothetical protein
VVAAPETDRIKLPNNLIVTTLHAFGDATFRRQHISPLS